MTRLDRTTTHPGYWPSPWPVECGGNRRQKASPGRLDAAAGTAEVTAVTNGRWNVMVIQRDPGQWYVGGTMAAFSGPPPFGWVQRIDPDTLEVVADSPELPCGEHVWCGAILAHANGSIMSINGSYLHRLDPDDLSVQAERALVDRSHNGLLALSDGSLVTKDLRLEGQGHTTVSRVDPDTLATMDELVLPEGWEVAAAAARVPRRGDWVEEGRARVVCWDFPTFPADSCPVSNPGFRPLRAAQLHGDGARANVRCLAEEAKKRGGAARGTAEDVEDGVVCADRRLCEDSVLGLLGLLSGAALLLRPLLRFLLLLLFLRSPVHARMI